MKRNRYQLKFEGMEERDLPAAVTPVSAALARRVLPPRPVRTPQPPQIQIKGTAFGALVDKGPGSIVIDTSRPLIPTSSFQSVYGILTRDTANNKVSGWLVVNQSGGKQVKLTVSGNAANTSVMGAVVNLRFSGEGEFAMKVRPGNIRLMLNTPLRGRVAITFA